MYVKTQDGIRWDLDEYNKDIFDIVSLSLQREIADKNYMEFFLNGYMTYNDDIYEITTNIYETEGLKLVETNTFKGKNFFDLIDEISIWIKKGLSIPDNHINSTVDMPASELLTSSLKAYKNYVQGYWNVWTANESVKHLEAAIKEDDEFAAAAVNKVFAIAVWPKNYVMPRLRGITIESDYEVANQRRVLVASQRIGFTDMIAAATSVHALQYKGS